MTEEELSSTIKSMRDSVWAINDGISQEYSEEVYNYIQRNVGHLNIMMSNPEISESGQDLSDIIESITIGQQYLDDHSIESP
jgi:hypothetical protein